MISFSPGVACRSVDVALLSFSPLGRRRSFLSFHNDQSSLDRRKGRDLPTGSEGREGRNDFWLLPTGSDGEGRRDTLRRPASVRSSFGVLFAIYAALRGCELHLGIIIEIGDELFLYALPNEGRMATPIGSVLSTSSDGRNWAPFTPVGPQGWGHTLLGISHVEDRDQDGMEMQTV